MMPNVLQESFNEAKEEKRKEVSNEASSFAF